jgi:hypothetical protein
MPFELEHNCLSTSAISILISLLDYFQDPPGDYRDAMSYNRCRVAW